MNKSELIDAVAASADLSKADAGRAVGAVFDTIIDALGNDETVTLIGFGTFATKERAAREGRNPQTGEKIQIAATTLPVWKAGKSVKDAVAKNRKQKVAA